MARSLTRAHAPRGAGNDRRAGGHGARGSGVRGPGGARAAKVRRARPGGAARAPGAPRDRGRGARDACCRRCPFALHKLSQPGVLSSQG